MCGAPAVGEVCASAGGRGEGRGGSVGEGEVVEEVTAVVDVCAPEPVPFPFSVSTEVVCALVTSPPNVKGIDVENIIIEKDESLESAMVI